jgi:hypothetical protein
MIDRRRALRLTLAALPAAAWLASPARAEEAFERLYPFLVDLPGWTGDKPDGVAMSIGSVSIMTASRKYKRDDGAHIEVNIMSGAPAQAGLAMLKSGMQINTSEGHVITETVDGVKIARTYTVKDKAGALLIGMGDTTIFNIGYAGISEDDALALARKFDWKAIQAALPTK